MTEAEPIGYASPPRATRFRKGHSGNPRGRPPGSHRDVPHNAVLGQMVTIRENGRERRVTAAEAFLLQLTRKGLAGDSAAARSSLEAIEAARARRPVQQGIDSMVVVLIGMGIEVILGKLGMARKKYPRDEHRVRWEIQPWIVEAALARLGNKRLTKAEQREVWDNTRTPHKVQWPDWWTARG